MDRRLESVAAVAGKIIFGLSDRLTCGYSRANFRDIRGHLGLTLWSCDALFYGRDREPLDGMGGACLTVSVEAIEILFTLATRKPFPKGACHHAA